jgi:predicted TIM-barrel fold metal-dependent hydrolase
MILDFHTHIFPSVFRDNRETFFSSEPAFETLYNGPEARLSGVSELLDHMDKEGVERSVVFGFPWEEPDHYRRHNDYIMEAVRKHPQRLTGFCSFSPLSPGAIKETERCLDSGLSGVGELAVYGTGFSSEVSDALKEIAGLCVRFDVPLLLHTNEPVGHPYPGKTPMTLNQVYSFLKANPINRIILAHWGGGILFYGLLKREIREVFQNVWFDTAASPFLYRPEVYRIAGEIVGFEKILFGSDYPLIRPQRYFKEIESTGLPPEVTRGIKGLNAARLLRL